MNVSVQVTQIYVFNSFGFILRSGFAGSYGNAMFSFLRNCQTVFQSGCTILPAIMRAPVSLHLCSVQFSRSVTSNSLWSHGLQYTRLPCPSTTPRACSNLCPSSQWCHPTISSSVVPFSFCLQSFPASGSFPMSQFSASGGQSIGASASTSVLPMDIQDWSPLGLTGLISLMSKGLSRVFSNTSVRKHQFFSSQPSLWSSSHIHIWLLEKSQLWVYRLCRPSSVSLEL